eukprot:5791252-Heterocapsa_arctica.AAC.1
MDIDYGLVWEFGEDYVTLGNSGICAAATTSTTSTDNLTANLERNDLDYNDQKNNGLTWRL